MDKRRSRFVPGVSFVNETLERRMVLSGIMTVSAPSHVAVEVMRDAATKTSLEVSAGTLGQPITFTATVRAAAASGAPSGTVNILDHGKVIQTLTLSPTTSTNHRYATSEATATLSQPPGDSAYYFGRHQITAEFVPSGAYSKSAAARSFSVKPPAYTTLDGGVKVSTIAQGSGPEIQAGQTANVMYTGYLSKSGHIFDDSINNGGAPLTFTSSAGQMIPGFDAGTAGMKAGESRVILIPPSEGYGAAANGSIPANSTLIFVVTLTSIS